MQIFLLSTILQINQPEHKKTGNRFGFPFGRA